MVLPSMSQSAGKLPPASNNSIGNRSMFMTGSLETFPAGICPYHEAMKGT